MAQQVEKFDGPGRYQVASDKPNTLPYLVDLLAYDGEGQCTCQDWEYRIGKYLRDEVPPEKRFCKHILAAREKFLDEIIGLMLRPQNPG